LKRIKLQFVFIVEMIKASKIIFGFALYGYFLLVIFRLALDNIREKGKEAGRVG